MKMRGKIFGTTLSVTLCALAACTAIIFGMLYNYFEKNYLAELRGEEELIAESVEIYGKEYLYSVDFGEKRVTYIADDGTVIFDSMAESASMENHSEREEFTEAVANGRGDSVRYSETLSEKTYYLATRLSDGTVLRVSGTKATVRSLTLKLFTHILLAVLIAVALSAVFSKRLAKKVVEPINRIDLSNPKDADVYEELAPLLERISSQNDEITRQMETLKKERREFSAITENMREGFVVTDKNTNVLLSNKAVSELLGNEAKPGGSIYILNRDAAFLSAIERALSGVSSSNVIKKDGRYINVMANPVFSEKNIIGCVIILTDVTEKEERETLRREFTANVSHELKTPLTSISGAAEMMRNGMVKADDIAHFAENIYREAQRLITLVGDIIKLSRLDEGEIYSSFEEADCAKLVKNAVGAIERSASKKSIDIKCDIEDIRLYCIPPLFEEMVCNLTDNAVKYTPEGGEVRVSFKREMGGAYFAVSDNGIGIPKKDRDRIFERFYRIDKSHSKEIGGTGLGLSIVKHGALIHGARIELESAEGKGSTFILHFTKTK